MLYIKTNFLSVHNETKIKEESKTVCINIVLLKSSTKKTIQFSLLLKPKPAYVQYCTRIYHNYKINDQIYLKTQPIPSIFDFLFINQRKSGAVAG